MNKSVLLLSTGNIRRQDHGSITINETRLSSRNTRNIARAKDAREYRNNVAVDRRRERKERKKEGERSTTIMWR